MKVILLSYTNTPERLISSAAKLCYSPSSIESIEEDMTDDKSKEFIKMLSQIGHESPIEHASFTFGIEGVSRSLLAQITRHRIASFSVQSQRYVQENQFSFVVPPEIERNKTAKQEFLEAMKEDQMHYNNLVKILQQQHMDDYIKEGYEIDIAKKKANKTAIEDARFILPNACETKMIATFNARSLRNFFSLRCCNRAQWEIRELALQMFKLVYQVAPELFSNAGPNCINGKCSEGKMSCGKAEQVRKYFDEIKEEIRCRENL